MKGLGTRLNYFPQIKMPVLHLTNLFRAIGNKSNLIGSWQTLTSSPPNHIYFLLNVRAKRIKQLHWLATNTDVITTQSHSCLAFSREKTTNRVNSRVYTIKPYHEWVLECRLTRWTVLGSRDDLSNLHDLIWSLLMFHQASIPLKLKALSVRCCACYRRSI